MRFYIKPFAAEARKYRMNLANTIAIDGAKDPSVDSWWTGMICAP